MRTYAMRDPVGGSSTPAWLRQALTPTPATEPWRYRSQICIGRSADQVPGDQPDAGGGDNYGHHRSGDDHKRRRNTSAR